MDKDTSDFSKLSMGEGYRYDVHMELGYPKGKKKGFLGIKISGVHAEKGDFANIS